MAQPVSDEQYFAPMEERAQALREELEKGYPESWQYENAGDTLIGVLVNVDVGHTQRWGPKRIAVLEDPQTKERKSVWLLHTALVSQFQRAAPAIGELVAVRYDGKKMSQDGANEYDGWTVRVDRPKDTKIDWGALPGEESAPTVAGRRATDAQVVPQPIATTAPSFNDPVDDDIPFDRTIDGLGN